MKLSTVIRIVLSFGLVYMIYAETGAWTCIALSLMLLNAEMSVYVSKHQSKRIEKLEQKKHESI